MPVFTPAQPSIPNVFNFSPQNLKNWRKALAKVRAGAANSRVLVMGDSTTLGINSSGATNWPNITDALASLLNGAGTTANANGFAGASVAGSTTGSRLGTDTRLTAGSWSSALDGGGTLGGAILKVSSGTTPLTFLPTANVDTFNVLYSSYGSGGIAHLQATGGSQQTINETTDPAGMNSKICAAASLGSNTLSATYVSGGAIYIEAVEAYNSAVKSVNIMNAGWWGSKSADWVTTGFSFTSFDMLKYLAPDLMIIVAGINDWGNSVSVATFTANIQTLITAAQLSGDVILVTPTPNATNLSIQPNYIAALYQLAALNGCVLIDDYARWVSYTVSNALGLYADSVHPTAAGYADQAQVLKNVMLNV